MILILFNEIFLCIYIYKDIQIFNITLNDTNLSNINLTNLNNITILSNIM